jgi:hypothetical protein
MGFSRGASDQANVVEFNICESFSWDCDFFEKSSN